MRRTISTSCGCTVDVTGCAASGRSRTRNRHREQAHHRRRRRSSSRQLALFETAAKVEISRRASAAPQAGQSTPLLGGLEAEQPLEAAVTAATGELVQWHRAATSSAICRDSKEREGRSTAIPLPRAPAATCSPAARPAARPAAPTALRRLQRPRRLALPRCAAGLPPAGQALPDLRGTLRRHAGAARTATGAGRPFDAVHAAFRHEGLARELVLGLEVPRASATSLEPLADRHGRRPRAGRAVDRGRAGAAARRRDGPSAASTSRNCSPARSPSGSPRPAATRLRGSARPPRRPAYHRPSGSPTCAAPSQPGASCDGAASARRRRLHDRRNLYACARALRRAGALAFRPSSRREQYTAW